MSNTTNPQPKADGYYALEEELAMIGSKLQTRLNWLSHFFPLAQISNEGEPIVQAIDGDYLNALVNDYTLAQGFFYETGPYKANPQSRPGSSGPLLHPVAFIYTANLEAIRANLSSYADEEYNFGLKLHGEVQNFFAKTYYARYMGGSTRKQDIFKDFKSIPQDLTRGDWTAGRIDLEISVNPLLCR